MLEFVWKFVPDTFYSPLLCGQLDNSLALQGGPDLRIL